MARPGSSAVRLHYHPTEKQALFHCSTADEVLFGGAAGGGKTAAQIGRASCRERVCLYV